MDTSPSCDRLLNTCLDHSHGVAHEFTINTASDGIRLVNDENPNNDLLPSNQDNATFQPTRKYEKVHGFRDVKCAGFGRSASRCRLLRSCLIGEDR
jgi:hypothetical protein